MLLLAMHISDDGDLMQMREGYSISLLSRSTIPSSFGGNAASLLSSGPGLNTGTSFASGFRSGIVTQDRLFPGLGPSSTGLEPWEAVNRSNCEAKQRANDQHTVQGRSTNNGKRRKQSPFFVTLLLRVCSFSRLWRLDQSQAS